MHMKTMRRQFRLIAFMLALVMTMGVVSCSDDDDDGGQDGITLSTLKAGDIDMNGATAPNNVPSDPVIVATFSSDVDAATATASNVTITRDYDDANIPLTVVASGKTITITPSENLASGALHTLTINTGVKSTGGTSISKVERTFTTEGFFAPAGMVAYWNFEDNADDQVGEFNPSATVDVTYVAGRKAQAGKAASFNGTTSIIEIPNGDQLMSDNFTLSFWVNAAPDKNHFVMGLAAFHGFQYEIGGDAAKLAATYKYQSTGDSTFSHDIWWNGDGKNKDNGGWQGTTVNKDVSAAGGVRAIFNDKWAHVVVIVNGADKKASMYINGELVLAHDFTLWPANAREKRMTGLKYNGKEPDVYNDLAFGFVQSRRGTLWDEEPWGGYDIPASNHFDGMLDDVRIFNKAVSEAEVTLMYNSEKP